MFRLRIAARPTLLVILASAAACSESAVPDNGLPEQGPPASQAASVTQHIHTAEVAVHYSRPVARGRELFGTLVAWDEMWTPGANRATYVTTTEDLRVEGHLLPAGSYSLWLRPVAEGPWTVVFSDAWDMFHLPYPEGEESLTLEATPVAGSHMESLAIYFPEVDGYEATMHVHWGSTVLPLRLEVPVE